MKQSRHLNPSKEIGTGCLVTSKYGRTAPNKHVGVGRQQQFSIVREDASSNHDDGDSTYNGNNVLSEQ